jgi:hypothetical protein
MTKGTAGAAETGSEYKQDIIMHRQYQLVQGMEGM